MNTVELSKEIAKKAKISASQAEKLVDSFGHAIETALLKGQKVVYSNFGTFYLVNYPSKVIYHPKYRDKKMVMLPTNVVKWMPSGNIKDLVNLGVEMESATAHGTRKKVLDIPRSPKFSTIATETKESESFEQEIPIKTFTQPNAEDYNLPPENQPQNDDETNIYEELMNDGSKVESTFKDAIRVHKDRTKSFFGRVFNRSNNTTQSLPNSNDQPSGKVSLSGAGIFDNSNPLPNPKPNVEPTWSEKTTNNEAMPKNVPVKVDGPMILEPHALNPNKPHVISPDHTPDSEFKTPVKEIVPFSLHKDPVSYIDLSTLTISKDLLSVIPEKIARKYKAVPIEDGKDSLVVAMADPQDIEAKELIKKLTQKNIIPRLATQEDILRILDQYSGLETELTEAIKEGETEKEKAESVASQNQNAMAISSSDNAPAARIVTSLLRRAIRDKASDIHIEPNEKDVTVRFRIDGILQKSAVIPKDIQSAVTSRVKILSNLKIDEQRLPQDGRFSINFDDRKIDFRVSTLPTACGEKVVMRVLDKATGILTIEQLGMRGRALQSLENSLEKSHGMVLVTGPTGSGKTTTLYALIDKLYSEGVNIVTLEDPIEYRMPGINQSQVNAEIKYSFASGLRSIVRQDPDIIMIGEIRDGETAEMAVHAALTGHVVLSTLHTNDSAGATPRLIDMGVEPFLLTSSINAVVGQRLGRKICEHCKEEIKLPQEEIDKIQKEIDRMSPAEKEQIKDKELKFYHGKGCKVCNNSGYKGRVGLFEVLGISEPIKEMILAKESSNKIEEKAISEGMITMLHDGILKALDGITTVEEVWRTTLE